MNRPFHQVVAVAAAASPVLDTRTAAFLLPLVLDSMLAYFDEHHSVTPERVRELADKDPFYAAACYSYARCCKTLGLESKSIDLVQAREDAKQALNATMTAAAVAYRQA